MQIDLVDHRWIDPVYQTTLRHPIWCRGVGVHSGKICEVHLQPADIHTGVTFVVNTNETCSNPTSAIWHNARPNNMRTTLIADNSSEVSTIEHLMSALVVSGVDNVQITTIGGELPILDGSAYDWMFLLACAGQQIQPAVQRAIVVTECIRVETKFGWIELSPSDNFKVGYEIAYDHPMIKDEFVSFDITRDIFNRDIANARTFGFERDAIHVKKLGLALGASLTNTVVFDQQSVMNNNGLRWPNEPLRHKILDIIGDLFLAGAPIIGEVHGYCSGHSLNYELVKKLMTTPTAWVWSC